MNDIFASNEYPYMDSEYDYGDYEYDWDWGNLTARDIPKVAINIILFLICLPVIVILFLGWLITRGIIKIFRLDKEEVETYSEEPVIDINKTNKKTKRKNANKRNKNKV